MKSKFNFFSVFFMLALFSALIILTIFIIVNPYDACKNGNLPQWFLPLFSVIGLCFIAYHIFTRINRLHISKDSIQSRNLLLPRYRAYLYTDLDELNLQTELGHFRKHEILLLKNQEQTLLKISSFYYSNYEELRLELLNTLTQHYKK